jgi:ubiquinone/menaquinone biosynthesis C-methylase UbiE
MEVDHQETLEKLLGDVNGKRVLEIGCGDGTTAIRLAQRGATVIAVDPSGEAIAAARAAATQADVRIDLRVSNLADLAFIRADSVDIAYSDLSLAALAEIDRVFRQTHRVLRPGAWFTLALPHPVGLCVAIDAEPEGALPLARPYLTRSYFDPEPVGEIHPHTMSGVFAGLGRAGFRIDALVELAAEESQRPEVPTVVIWRGRKEGL